MEIPVLHLVNRFWIGGAERQFVERLRRHPAGFEAVLGCLELSGPLLDQVRALGYEPFLFPLPRSFLRANTIKQVARIAALIRELGVRIVYGTEFNTNLLALLSARLAGAKAIVSRVDLGHLRDGFGKWHREAEKWSARHADLVVANADAVREVCIREEGCKPERVIVVRNGLDLARFDELAGQPLQAPLPIGPEDATVAFLPSAHIAQRVVIELLPIRMGMPVTFAESLHRRMVARYVAGDKCFSTQRVRPL